jgi:hypothetical protein
MVVAITGISLVLMVFSLVRGKVLVRGRTLWVFLLLMVAQAAVLSLDVAMCIVFFGGKI